jgi:hypothetical protein
MEAPPCRRGTLKARFLVPAMSSKIISETMTFKILRSSDDEPKELVWKGAIR